MSEPLNVPAAEVPAVLTEALAPTLKTFDLEGMKMAYTYKFGTVEGTITGTAGDKKSNFYHQAHGKRSGV